MTFIKDNFLLETQQAEELYHGYAKEMPIIDYHNHLSPEHVANNHQFKNLTEAWLMDDHYKWRAMRACGIDEAYITGGATDREKFQKWAETVPHTLRNPLYHWTHLELKRYFGIDDLLSGQNAERIFQETREQLQEKSHSAIGLLQQFNVEVICTTDDPADNLEHHQSAAQKHTSPKMLPTFRPEPRSRVRSRAPLAYGGSGCGSGRRGPERIVSLGAGGFWKAPQARVLPPGHGP